MRGELKEIAARFVQEVGTWSADDDRDAVARIVAAGYPADLLETAKPLFGIEADDVRTTIVYPQYGGLTDTSASVIVLARQEWRDQGNKRSREVEIDVRLRSAATGWAVTSVVDPARPPGPPQVPGGPTAQGQAVLGNPRIALPDPVREDIAGRRLGDPIMAVMTALAAEYMIEAQVVITGHPGTVYPTTRLSNHVVGRAVDVRSINGVRVVDIDRADPVLTAFMAAAGRAGATEVGGPIRVAGTGFFTDDVHQDHIHLGITPTKPPAVAA